jgi:response regulator RpfG family c-di-GMP phosphodiesterase
MTSAGESGKRPAVLIVDDEPVIIQLCTIQLTGDGLDCDHATSGDTALAKLAERAFDVVITDVKMPRMSGLDVLKAVKQKDPEIQVILITGNPDIPSAVEAIRSHVDDFLVKPFELRHLSHSVARALEHRALLQENLRYRGELERLVREQARQIERLFLDGLSALAAAIEARDRYTGGHLDRVTRYALSTGAEMGLDEQQLWNLWLGSLFHDVGKLAIPDAILNKPGPLTADEYEFIKKHPELGVQIVERISFLVPAARAILHHQERYDGQGYPQGLEGEDVCIEGRILAVADAFDAMLTDRPYRLGRTEDQAVEELMRCSGTQFDPTVVEAFLRCRDKGFPAEMPTTHHPAVQLAYGKHSDSDPDSGSEPG